MNREYIPTFVGPNAKRASRMYAKYDFANRMLDSIDSLSIQLRLRVVGNSNPINVIDIDSVENMYSEDINTFSEVFYFLTSIDGIGPATARSILAKYNNFIDLTRATPDDFDAIAGISKKRAEALVQSIRKHFKQRNK